MAHSHGWQLLTAVGPPTLVDETGPRILVNGLDCLYLVSLCGLGFLQHGRWIPEESILKVSISREPGGSSIRFLMTWPQEPQNVICLALHWSRMLLKVARLKGEGVAYAYREGRH